MRLIDADELKNDLTGICICSDKVNDYNKAVKAFIEFIDSAPTVDVKPFANVTFDKDELKRIIDEQVIEPIKNGELVVKTEERPQGEWIHNSDRPDNLICSVCNCGWDMWRYESKELNFCPNCGADMRKEAEND